MKRFLSLSLLLALAFGCNSAPPSPPTPTSSPNLSADASATPALSPSPDLELAGALQPDLQTDKSSYTVGEKIEVTVIAVGLTESAWVWMVPEDMEVKPTARPDDTPHPNPVVGSAPVELVAEQAGKYQLYLFPSSEMSAPIASRAVEIQ